MYFFFLLAPYHQHGIFSLGDFRLITNKLYRDLKKILQKFYNLYLKRHVWMKTEFFVTGSRVSCRIKFTKIHFFLKSQTKKPRRTGFDLLFEIPLKTLERIFLSDILFLFLDLNLFIDSQPPTRLSFPLFPPNLFLALFPTMVVK